MISQILRHAILPAGVALMACHANAARLCRHVHLDDQFEYSTSKVFRDLQESTAETEKMSYQDILEDLQGRGQVRECGPNCFFFQDDVVPKAMLDGLRIEVESLRRYASFRPEEVFIGISRYENLDVPAFDGLIFDRQTLKLKARLQLKGSFRNHNSMTLNLNVAFSRVASFSSVSRDWAQMLFAHAFRTEKASFLRETPDEEAQNRLLRGTLAVRRLLRIFHIADPELKTRIVIHVTARGIPETILETIQSRLDADPSTVESVTIMNGELKILKP